MRGLDPATLAGSVTTVPIVNVASFRERTPFVSPGDGKNLNRCFPGDPGGTYSDQLAHHVFTELISPADAADRPARRRPGRGARAVRALRRLAGRGHRPGDGGRVRAALHRAHRARGRADRRDDERGGGRRRRGRDHGRGGRLRAARGRRRRGARARLPQHDARGWGCSRAPSSRRRSPQRMVERFVWLRCREAGWWQPSVRVGEEVAAGGRLGAVLDPFGDELEVDRGARGRRAALHHVEPGRRRRRPAARPGRRHHRHVPA